MRRKVVTPLSESVSFERSLCCVSVTGEGEDTHDRYSPVETQRDTTPQEDLQKLRICLHTEGSLFRSRVDPVVQEMVTFQRECRDRNRNGLLPTPGR